MLEGSSEKKDRSRGLRGTPNLRGCNAAGRMAKNERLRDKQMSGGNAWLCCSSYTVAVQWGIRASFWFTSRQTFCLFFLRDDGCSGINDRGLNKCARWENKIRSIVPFVEVCSV